MDQISQAPVEYKLCWLKEPLAGEMMPDLGLPVADSDLELALLGLLPAQRPFAADASLSFEQVSIALGSWERFAASPIWFQRLLTVFFGSVRNRQDFEILQARAGLMESIAAKVRDLSRKHHHHPYGAIDVYLPQLCRQEWPQRFDILAAAAFASDSGSIYPEGLEPDGFEHVAARIAASVFSGTENQLALTFDSACSLGRPFFHSLNNHYRVSIPRRCHPQSVRVSVPANAVDSWRGVALSNGAMHTRAMSRFAFAMQSMFRAWVPALSLAGDGGWQNRDLVTDMLVYTATPPFIDAPTHLAYDVLDPEHNELIRERLRRRMPSLWQRLREYWMAEGEIAMAREYAPRRAANETAAAIARAMHQRRYRSMLVAEGLIATAVGTFLHTVSSATSPRRIPPAIRDLDQVFRTQLQRLVSHNEQAAATLRMLVMIEATNAFHCSLGGDHALRIQFTDSNGFTHGNLGAEESIQDEIPLAA